MFASSKECSWFISKIDCLLKKLPDYFAILVFLMLQYVHIWLLFSRVCKYLEFIHVSWVIEPQHFSFIKLFPTVFPHEIKFGMEGNTIQYVKFLLDIEGMKEPTFKTLRCLASCLASFAVTWQCSWFLVIILYLYTCFCKNFAIVYDSWNCSYFAIVKEEIFYNSIFTYIPGVN